MFEQPVPPRERGPSREWTVTYVKSVTGILKIVEMVMSLIAFISAITFPYQWYRGIGFTTFVGVTGLLQSAASFIVHIINFFPDEMIAYLIELIVYAVWTVLFLIAAILAAVVADDAKYSDSSYRASSGAAAFFCFVCLIAWGFDAALQFMAWWNRRRGGPQSAADTGPPPPASDAPTY